MSCEGAANFEDTKKSYCEPSDDLPKMGKNAVVLSSNRFEGIVNNAHNVVHQRFVKEAEKEHKYREYLKKANEELVAKFSGKVPRTEMDKIRQISEQNELKLQKVKKSYEEAKENEEKKRLERIAHAQDLVDKMKPGPRQLRSAVVESEIYRGREIQLKLKQEYQNALKKQEYIDKKRCEGQVNAFIKEEQQRIDERKKEAIAYKDALLKAINDHAKQRKEVKERTLAEERKELLLTDSEIQAQIERERAAMEKKRAVLRQNALEAMKMVEQRRLRERMIDEVESRLCCVYNAGKKELDQLRDEHSKELQEERMQKIANVSKDLAGIDSKENEQNQRLRRDISTMQLKFTAEEQEKINRDRAAKKARIEAYCREQEAAKLAKQHKDEEKRFDIANRLKNDEVNCLFNESKKQENYRRIKDVRSGLEKQIKEKQLAIKSERKAQRAFVPNGYEHDDRFFFRYANNLMQHAKQKQRPLYPLAKAVQNYNRDNHIFNTGKQPKYSYMTSQIPINSNGVNARGNDQSKGGYSMRRNTSNSRHSKQLIPMYSQKTEESIIRNFNGIEDLLKESNGIGQSQNTLSCLKQEKVDMKIKNSNCDIELKPPSKLRYSMDELKSLNQFACN